MKHSSDNEGLILVCGMVIIVSCISGSMATGIGPVEFFFIGALTLGVAAIIIGASVLAIIVAVKVSVEAHKEGGRSMRQILTEDYSPKALMGDYYKVVVLLRKFIGEVSREGFTGVKARLEKYPRYVAFRIYTRNLALILFNKDKS